MDWIILSGRTLKFSGSHRQALNYVRSIDSNAKISWLLLEKSKYFVSECLVNEIKVNNSIFRTSLNVYGKNYAKFIFNIVVNWRNEKKMYEALFDTLKSKVLFADIRPLVILLLLRVTVPFHDTSLTIQGPVNSWFGRLLIFIYKKKGLKIISNCDYNMKGLRFLSVEYDLVYPSINTVSMKEVVLDKRKGVLNIGFVASIVPFKGLHLLFEAVEELDRVHVHVFGDSPKEYGWYKSDCLKLAKRLDSRIIWHGWCSDKSLMYESMDVLCIPSFNHGFYRGMKIKGNEGLPTIIQEALSYNKPIIGSSNAGIPEVIGDYNNGVIFDMNSKNSLKNVIISLLSKRVSFELKY